MASWRKLLARMVSDPNPRSFTYEEAASVLGNLGFHLAKPGGGSHRKWRRVVEAAEGKRTVIIGLVEKGSGTLRPEYVKDMVRILRENGLLPDGV
jgi:hypothetical protein